MPKKQRVQRISYLELLSDAVMAARPKMTRRQAEKLIIKRFAETANRLPGRE